LGHDPEQSRQCAHDSRPTRERHGAPLGQAVVAYREALKERTRERVPLDWAMTQNNLGAALMTLAVRESGTARLEEAIVAYREALKERTRERVPLNWAMSFGSQGLVLMLLAERTKDPVLAQSAFLQIEAAFETSRAGGNAALAALYEPHLADARRLCEALKVV
jgi:hypothetical protein